MYLNSGLCLELFSKAKHQSVNQREIYEAIFRCIDPEDDTDFIPSNIKAGRAEVPKRVRTAMLDQTKRSDQLIRFTKDVTPLIEDNLEMLVGAFLLILEKDRTIKDTVKISSRSVTEWKAHDFSIRAEDFLLGIIAFAFSRRNTGGSSVDGLSENFYTQARRLGNKLTFSNSVIMQNMFTSNIPAGARFEATFYEIPIRQENNNVSLRLFHLDAEPYGFSYDSLKRYFIENLFRHVHTVNEINGYQRDGLISSMHNDARKNLKDRYEEAPGSALETLLVESCISDATGAKKIINLLERDKDGIPSGSHGIHFMKQYNGKTGYQIIVSIAAMTNSNSTALKNAFSDIATIASSDKTWRLKLFSQSMLRTKMSEADAQWIADTFLPRSINQPCPSIKYGVFIGYTHAIQDNLSYLETILANEVLALIPSIQDQITENHLESTEFDFYFIPFNDAEGDKSKIIEGILE